MRQKDSREWLTHGLLQEMEMLLPTQDEISVTGDGDRVRNLDAFKTKVGSFFIVGRTFVNYRQFVACGKFLLDAWAVEASHSAKSLYCFYGKPYKRKQSALGLRAQTPSLKEIKCPFRVRYTFVNATPEIRKAGGKYPDVLKNVKVTNVVLEHTCELSIISHRVAKCKSKSQIPTRAGFNSFVLQMRLRPHMDSEQVRANLSMAFPHSVSIDAQMACNLRRKALLVIGRGIQPDEVDPVILLRHSRIGPVAAEQSTAAESAITRQNFGTLLQECMRNSESTWKTLAFLEHCSSNIPGFVFDIHKDEDGCPDRVCWMFNENRQNLLRYGDILFLDMRKTTVNNLGYPYFAITMIDQNRRPVVGLECLVCRESLDGYKWGLLTATKMEPRFRLQDVKIIAADQFMKKSLLVDLGINESCTLRGDPYHLNQSADAVFRDNFGPQFFPLIQGNLSRMLVSTFKAEWERNYAHARTILSSDPAKVALLDAIHANPRYYAGYHVASIPGNIGVISSTPAEQNHSSLEALFRSTTVMPLHDQVKMLFDRQQRQIRERVSKSNDWTVKQSYLPTNCDLPYSVIERTGRNVLDRIPFQDYLLKQIRRAKFLTKDITEEGCIVYPSDRSTNEARVEGLAYNIRTGERCPCSWRISYSGQCAHELYSDAKFHAEKWDQRWYNNKYHGTVVPSSWNSHLLTGAGADAENNEHTADEENNEDTAGEQIPQADGGIIQLAASNQTAPPQLTYSYLVLQFRELASIIQHDQRQMTDCAALIEDMSNRARNRRSLVAYFPDERAHAPSRLNEQRNVNKEPVTSVSNTPKARNTKRKMSAAEKQMRKRQKTLYHGDHEHGDDGDDGSWREKPPVLKEPARARNTKTCRLCRQGGHQVARCPLVQIYGGRFLTTRNAQKSQSERNHLANSLSDPAVYTTGARSVGQAEVPMATSLPPIGKDGVLVIHRRVYIDRAHPQLDSVENMCFECTLIKTGGDLEAEYSSRLFELGCIRNHVTKNLRSLILSLLVPASGLLSQMSQFTENMNEYDTESLAESLARTMDGDTDNDTASLATAEE
jgi:hypothetical protein